MKYEFTKSVVNKQQYPTAGTQLKSNDGEEFTAPLVGMFNDPTVVNRVTVYLDQPILDLAHYRQVTNFLYNMEEHDQCNIIINSPGGDLDTAKELVQAILNAKGDVVCTVTGRCHSAASYIALSVPQVVITPNAYMLCHAATHGSYGKQQEVHSRIVYEQEQIIKDLWSAYEGFLTEEEFELMLLGKDYWFDYDEILRRLELRKQYQEENSEDSSDIDPGVLQ